MHKSTFGNTAKIVRNVTCLYIYGVKMAKMKLNELSIHVFRGVPYVFIPLSRLEIKRKVKNYEKCCNRYTRFRV